MKFIATQVLEPDPEKRDLDRCDEMVAACFASEDYVEGRTAFTPCFSKPSCWRALYLMRQRFS
ncbi:MAG: hypothetical protein ACR2QF_08310 [Geminicoccaceae bacterium]